MIRRQQRPNDARGVRKGGLQHQGERPPSSSPPAGPPRRRPGGRRCGRPERPALLLARVRGPGAGGPSRAPHSSAERSQGQIRPRPGSRHKRASPGGWPSNPRRDRPTSRFVAAAGVAEVLARGPIRGGLQARLAVARVAEQPTASTAASLPSRTRTSSLAAASEVGPRSVVLLVPSITLKPARRDAWVHGGASAACACSHPPPGGRATAEAATVGVRSASRRSSAPDGNRHQWRRSSISLMWCTT